MATQSALKSGARDLTKGNPFVLMIKFALPLFLSQSFQQLYNIADGLIVGRFIGSDALAAVSSAGSLVFLLMSFFDGAALGAGVLISQYFGAKDDEKVSRAVHTDVALGLLSGLFLTVVGIFCTKYFLSWMQVDASVLPSAVEYFTVIFSGSIAMVMYNNLRGILTAVGDSKRPLYYLIISSLLNIALDTLFVAGFGWGVWSAALATIISQSASAVLCFIHLLRTDSVVKVRIRKIRVYKDMLGKIVKYGVPTGVQNSVIGFANTIVQSQINVFGKVTTAAFGSYAKLEGFVFLPIMSFNMATTTFVSQNLGAKQYDRAKKGARFGIFMAVIMAMIIGIIFYIFAEEFVGIFVNKTDPLLNEVIAQGTQQAHIETLFYFLLAFSHSVASVCRGAGKAVVPMMVMLTVWCVIRVIYIYLIMTLSGERSLIYWAYPITWSISSIIYAIYYLCVDWVHGLDDIKKVRHRKSAPADVQVD